MSVCIAFAGTVDIATNFFGLVVTVIAKGLLNAADIVLEPLLEITTMSTADVSRFVPGFDNGNNIGNFFIQAINIIAYMIAGVLICCHIISYLINLAHGEKVESVPKLIWNAVFGIVMVICGKTLLTMIFNEIVAPLSSALTEGVSDAGGTFSFSGVGSDMTGLGEITSAFDLNSLATLIVVLALMLIIWWNLIKLVLECAERYIICIFTINLSPLAFATMASENTKDTAKSWLQMFWSQCVLLILNIWVVGIARTALNNGLFGASNTEMVKWGLITYAFLKIAQRLDDMMQTAGLKITRTTGLDPISEASGVLRSIGNVFGGVASVAGHVAGVGKNMWDAGKNIISPLKGLEDYGGGCKAVGGQFISMDPSSVNSINIMDIRVPDDEDAKKMDDYETTGSLLTKKIHTVKSFLHLVVKDMTQEEEQLIDTSLYKVYGRFGITNDNDSIFDLENGGYKKMPLLEDLQKEMQNVPELHRICNILNPLIRGSMACYNRPTNVDLKAKYIVFDFNGMKGPTLTMSMFVVLDFVWTKIKEDRAKRKAVFIDECWKLIGTDSNEMAAEDVVEIFRTIRAYGGSAFAMTQDISQFYEYKGGKYGKAVIGNADTKIIMHLIPSEAKALQAAIQLTDSEMENVSNLGRGQGLVCSGAAKLFVDFIAAPYEKQEITTDAKSFYLQEKALKEKQHKEEQERLAAEKTNSNTDANDDDADLLNVTF